MNYETKYLIRWGIPGWILIMILGPYIFFNFKENIDEMTNIFNPLALGAFLTVIGVPLGYLLNQIHHSLFWVIRLFRVSKKIKKQDKWYEYFRKEIQVDNMFFSEKNDNDKIGQKRKERYQYLLSRKHELGGVMMSLIIASVVIFLINLCKEDIDGWSWFYFVVSFILFLLIGISRWYSSKNIDMYFEYYLKESVNLQNQASK